MKGLYCVPGDGLTRIGKECWKANRQRAGLSCRPSHYVTLSPIDQPQSIEVEEKPSTEAQSWAESFRRIESPEGSSCFEQIDFSGEILGRIWVSSSAVIEFTEK